METKTMTVGIPWKLMLSFAVPLMLGNVFEQMYTVTDTLVVGRHLGLNALGGLGAANWIVFLIVGVINGLTTGFSIKIAQDFGANKKPEMMRSIRTSMLLALILSAIFVAAGEICLKPLLDLLGTPAEALPYTAAYLRVYIAGIPVSMFFNMEEGILRAVGDSKSPLYAMIISSLLNVLFDILFIAVFNMGAAGAAVATLFSYGAAALFCYHRLRKHKLSPGGRVKYWDNKLAASLLGFGMPIVIQMIIISVGGLIVQAFVNGYGNIFLAGYTATNKLYGLVGIAATSFGFAMTTFIGQNSGAGKYDRVLSGAVQGTVLAIITAVSIGAAMLLVGKPLIGSFIDGVPEEKAKAMTYAWYYMKVTCFFLSTVYIIHAVRSAIQAIGNSVLPMIASAVELAMRLAVIWILTKLMGENGIFWADVAAWIAADVFLVISFAYVYRKFKNSVIKGVE